MKPQITKIKSENRDITANIREVKRIIKKYYGHDIPIDQIIQMKWTNLCRHKLLKVIQVEIENLNSPITSKEIEFHINHAFLFSVFLML